MKTDSIIIGKKYRLLESIGCGSFGEVFYGIHIYNIARDINTDKEFAVKLESNERRRSLVKIEAAIYRMFSDDLAFPKIYWSGTESEYNILVMDLLGPSIEDLMELCNQKFSITTSFEVAEQMVNIN